VFEARWARRWLLVAVIALATFGLTIALASSTWLTLITVIAALLAILAAWFAQRNTT
jgi:hypothetical protein